MTCTRFNSVDFANCEASAEQYQDWVSHFDECQECQATADAQFESDPAQLAIASQLGEARELDLEMPAYHSSMEIQISAIEDDEEVGLSADSLSLDFLQPPSHPEMLGRLGRYEVERVIGRGGMGVVFRAYDSDLHRVVALKVLAKHLSTSAAARRRFAREAQAAAAILHPNVLPIYNVEAGAATPFLVMQYVSGKSLQARVEHAGPLDVADVLRIGKQTAEALAAAHDQGLIHRDVKPANILLEDETDRTILGDFGLARTSDDASLTRSGIVTGTPHYMSPEQAKGEPVTVSSDLFSLGSVLYFMLAGYPPFRAESAMSVLHCVCNQPHRPVHEVNNDVPRELSQLIDRLLTKRAGARPASAAAVATQIEQLLARLQQGQLRIGLPWWSDRRAQLTGGVLLLAGLLVSWMTWGPTIPLSPTQSSTQGVTPGFANPSPNTSDDARTGTQPAGAGGTAGASANSAGAGQPAPGDRDAQDARQMPPNSTPTSPAQPGSWGHWDFQMDSLRDELRDISDDVSMMPALMFTSEQHSVDRWNTSTNELQQALDFLEQTDLPTDLSDRVLNKE